MTRPDPILEYATPTATSNPRWLRCLVAVVAGVVLFIPALIFLLLGMGALILSIAELMAPHGSIANAGRDFLAAAVFGGLGFLLGWTAMRLFDFAECNSLKVGK